MNLVTLFYEQVERRADHPALILHEKALDYWTLGKKVRGFACYLKDIGVTRGSKVAIVLPNVPEFCAGLLGTWAAGGVAVTVNPFYKKPELEYIFEKGDVEVVLSQKGNEQVKKAVGKRHHIEVRALDASLSDLPVHSGDVLENYDEAVMVFTGAEEGYPKGAILTHESLYADLLGAYHASAPLGEKEIVLAVLPLYQAFGIMTCLLYPLLMGGKALLVPRFTPEGILKIMETFPVTFFPGVPTMFASLCLGKREKSQAFSQARLLISGGAPLTQLIYDRFLEIYGRPLLQGYGLTEASPVVSLNPLDGSHKPLSVGKPCKGVTVKIVEGEVVIEGKNIMKGYYKDEEATKRALQPDGLHTGDLGYLDSENFLFLTGVKKRMLLMGGFNVYPKEVENVLLSHPLIQEASVFPEEDLLFYQVPVARIKVKGAVSEREITSYCKQYLANYKVPRKIYFMEESSL